MNYNGFENSDVAKDDLDSVSNINNLDEDIEVLDEENISLPDDAADSIEEGQSKLEDEKFLFVNNTDSIKDDNINAYTVDNNIETDTIQNVQNNLVSDLNQNQNLFSNESLDENLDTLNIPSNNNNNKTTFKTNGGTYYSFGVRVLVLVFCILALLGMTVGLCLRAANYGREKFVTYNESSSIDYKVCIDKNEFYDSDCLEENMQYISQLTNTIPVTFNYRVDLSDKIDYDLKYRVVGELRVSNKDSESVLYSSDDVLVPLTSVKDNNNSIQINTNLNINFKQYNNYVASYLSSYGLNSDAFLDVVLYLDENTGERKISSLTIPLSVQTFGINKDLTSISNKTVEIKDDSWTFINTICAIGTLICLVVSLILIARLIRLILKSSIKKDKYQRNLARILKEYDRAIVIAKGKYEFSDHKKLIEVASFIELLDARDTLEKPIIYVKINSAKSAFYVEDSDRVFKYVMKESDFE